jgi:anti-sigma factor RsiW
MGDELKSRLMRLVDGELDPAEAEAATALCRDDPVAAAYVASLAGDRALLRAAFPATATGLQRAEATIRAGFAARRRRELPGGWRCRSRLRC